MKFDALVSALRTLQDDCCGICGVPAERAQLVVDHDHATGFVRGLLCGQCNNDEGRHGLCDVECPVCRWRRQPAVSWLGVTVHYVSSWGTPAVLLDTWTPTVMVAHNLDGDDRVMARLYARRRAARAQSEDKAS